MADVILSSCCYNIVYSATSWGFSTTPGAVFSVTGDSSLPNGCYTIVTGVTASTITFNGNAQGTTGCTDPSCLDCCSDDICIDINNSTYSGYSGTYQIKGGYNSYPYWSGGTSSTGYI